MHFATVRIFVFPFFTGCKLHGLCVLALNRVPVPSTIIFTCVYVVLLLPNHVFITFALGRVKTSVIAPGHSRKIHTHKNRRMYVTFRVCKPIEIISGTPRRLVVIIRAQIRIDLFSNF